jgi:succinate dehydrogenase / fumarate reductase, cytochrome b subunit
MYAVALGRSTIGKKAIMAVTGIIWIGYVVIHMYGNLKVFQGAIYFNIYAESLRTIGEPVFGHLHLLTVARLFLILSLGLHIWAATSLFQQARIARPQSYATRKVVQANYASLTMRYGGVVILLFILFHLAHLTWGVPGVHNTYIRGDAYHNLISGFQSIPVTLIYMVALVALGLHLYHGTWSMFQTLGYMNDSLDMPVRILAWVLAIVVPVGFAIVPLAVLFGFVL